jgi:hypothetical protein
MARAGRHGITRALRRRTRLFVMGLMILVSFALAASASAKLTGEFTRFANCPYKNPEASKCIYSTTVGGEVVLGSRKVPIVNPAVLQGAVTKSDKNGFSKFIGATSGATLSKASQPVPGGLAGIVPAEKSPPLIKAGIAFFFENAFTSVSATLELAKPASEIRFSENNLGGEIGTALKLPVKIHLENPFLGASCFVGSSSAPIYWDLTSATTNPPPPNKAITGTVGEVEPLAEGSILGSKGTTLVDNAWAPPVATGCGGSLSFLFNPIVNGSAGLPVAAGENAAVLDNSAFITAAAAVATEDAENP